MAKGKVNVQTKKFTAGKSIEAREQARTRGAIRVKQRRAYVVAWFANSGAATQYENDMVADGHVVDRPYGPSQPVVFVTAA